MSRQPPQYMQHPNRRTMPGYCHFAGRLTQADLAPVQGLHQINLHLVDDAGAQHVVYRCFGRGEDARHAGQALWRSLTIGARYHWASSLQQAGTLATYHAGTIVIALDARRIHPAIAAVPPTAPAAHQPQQHHQVPA